eukprot:maker-scaffold22_size673200-snap-gene-0.15 protein:Tk12661 transcript:maker-scaffold22_size673200-snap-gene-0.15-mRNA-1 annotation:"PREDICTED: uncharacterized protein LOC101744071"
MALDDSAAVFTCEVITSNCFFSMASPVREEEKDDHCRIGEEETLQGKIYSIGEEETLQGKLLGAHGPVLYCPFGKKSSGECKVVPPVIRLSIFGIVPFVKYGANSITGTDVDVVKIIAHYWGSKLTLRPEPNWFIFKNDTLVDGTYFSVANDRSDIGAGQITLNDRRYNTFETTTTIYPQQFVVISLVPKPYKPILNLLHPFPFVVWSSYMGSFLAMTLVSLILHFHYHRGRAWENLRSKYLGIFRSVVAQGVDPRDFVIRRSEFVIFVTWAIACVFMTFAYTCNLRANLMAVALQKPVDTENDIIERNIPVYFPENTYLTQAFTTSPLEIQRRIGEEAVKNNRFFKIVGGTGDPIVAKKIVDEGGAFVSTDMTMLANMAILERLFNGTLPFRIGRHQIFPSEFTIMVIKRGHKDFWVETNKVIDRLKEG